MGGEEGVQGHECLAAYLDTLLLLCESRAAARTALPAPPSAAASSATEGGSASAGDEALLEVKPALEQATGASDGAMAESAAPLQLTAGGSEPDPRALAHPIEADHWVRSVRCEG